MISRLVALVLCAVALAGCPKPRRILVPKVPSNGNPVARTRFLEAQAAFRRDAASTADDFTAIVEDFPDDPIAPWAKLYAGMAHVKAKSYAAAVQVLRPVAEADVEEGLQRKAQLYLGFARNYQRDHAGALPLLARGERAVEDDGERGEWLAAMAVATAAGDQPLDALPYFDKWYPLATAAEKGFILIRVGELSGAASASAAGGAFDRLDKKGPAAAILGYRVAADRGAAGDADGARKAREAVASARRAIGLPLAAAATSVAVPAGEHAGLVGAILPQSGKQARVGELAAQGLAVAAGAIGGGSGAVTVDLRSATSADEAAAAVDELASSGAVAVIGPIDGPAVDAAAGRANALHVPLLSLSPRPEERASGRWIYHVMHSAEQRARILARRAAAGGVRTFAVLAPENGYGRAVSSAFVDEVGKAGGTVIKRESYAADTKSFAGVARKLGKDWQAVFVADQADKLELIAPALAAAGHLPRPLGTKRATGGRPVLLLSTAEGLAPGYIVDAGRHSDGAMLAPGFYPDEKDPAIGDFVRRYQAGAGKPPAAVDAYAYDGAVAISAAGAVGRNELASRLDKSDAAGVTGTIRFDAGHRRADDGLVFTVVGGTEIRAQR